MFHLEGRRDPPAAGAAGAAGAGGAAGGAAAAVSAVGLGPPAGGAAV